MPKLFAIAFFFSFLAKLTDSLHLEERFRPVVDLRVCSSDGKSSERVDNLLKTIEPMVRLTVAVVCFVVFVVVIVLDGLVGAVEQVLGALRATAGRAGLGTLNQPPAFDRLPLLRRTRLQLSGRASRTRPTSARPYPLVSPVMRLLSFLAASTCPHPPTSRN